MSFKTFAVRCQMNGEKFTFVSSKLLTLTDFLRFFTYEKHLVLVEYNGKICNTNQGYNLLIKNNDRIEIITIVGGG